MGKESIEELAFNKKVSIRAEEMVVDNQDEAVRVLEESEINNFLKFNKFEFTSLQLNFAKYLVGNKFADKSRLAKMFMGFQFIFRDDELRHEKNVIDSLAENRARKKLMREIGDLANILSKTDRTKPGDVTRTASYLYMKYTESLEKGEDFRELLKRQYVHDHINKILKRNS